MMLPNPSLLTRMQFCHRCSEMKICHPTSKCTGMLYVVVLWWMKIMCGLFWLLWHQELELFSVSFVTCKKCFKFGLTNLCTFVWDSFLVRINSVLSNAERKGRVRGRCSLVRPCRLLSGWLQLVQSRSKQSCKLVPCDGECAVRWSITQDIPWREARDVWCLPPNLESQGFHLIPLYYLLSCSSACSHWYFCLFSVYWPILLAFFKKMFHCFSLRDSLFGKASVLAVKRC